MVSHEKSPFSIEVLKSLKDGNQIDPGLTAGSNRASTTPATHGVQPANLPNTVDTSSATKDDFFPLLPASFRTQEDNLEIPKLGTDPSLGTNFLQRNLNVQRLNEVHDWLWLAGRPMPPRGLHHQKMLGREIVVTEQMDMHLVWLRSQMFIKPMPRFLLQPSFWDKYLKCPDKCRCSKQQHGCEKYRLWDCALGFMLSYAALISYESDYHKARELHLLPAEVTWIGWKVLVKQLLEDTDIYNHINPRFLYGELRLGRLNKIYRFTGRSSLRGYKTGYSSYDDFFRDNFQWMASILGYVVIVLTAMQVGLSTTDLQNSNSFQSASYGFTVFSILAPLVALVVVVFLFSVLFVNNWVVTKHYKKKRFNAMGVTEHVSTGQKGTTV